MLRGTILVLVTMAFVALQCSEQTQDAQKGAWHFLPASGLRVRAPNPVAVESVDGRDTLTLRPDTRQPVVLILEKWNLEELSAKSEHQLETAGGLIIHYWIQHWGGGSGGEVTSVTGSMRTSSGVVGLNCTSQSEADQLEGECLALLATLREP